MDPLAQDVRRHGPRARGELDAAIGTTLLRDEDQLVLGFPDRARLRIVHFAGLSDGARLSSRVFGRVI